MTAPEHELSGDDLNSDQLRLTGVLATTMATATIATRVASPDSWTCPHQSPAFEEQSNDFAILLRDLRADRAAP